MNSMNSKYVGDQAFITAVVTKQMPSEANIKSEQNT